MKVRQWTLVLPVSISLAVFPESHWHELYPELVGPIPDNDRSHHLLDGSDQLPSYQEQPLVPNHQQLDPQHFDSCSYPALDALGPRTAQDSQPHMDPPAILHHGSPLLEGLERHEALSNFVHNHPSSWQSIVHDNPDLGMGLTETHANHALELQSWTPAAILPASKQSVNHLGPYTSLTSSYLHPQRFPPIGGDHNHQFPTTIHHNDIQNQQFPQSLIPNDFHNREFPPSLNQDDVQNHEFLPSLLQNNPAASWSYLDHNWDPSTGRKRTHTEDNLIVPQSWMTATHSSRTSYLDHDNNSNTRNMLTETDDNSQNWMNSAHASTSISQPDMQSGHFHGISSSSHLHNNFPSIETFNQFQSTLGNNKHSATATSSNFNPSNYPNLENDMHYILEYLTQDSTSNQSQMVSQNIAKNSQKTGSSKDISHKVQGRKDDSSNGMESDSQNDNHNPDSDSYEETRLHAMITDTRKVFLTHPRNLAKLNGDILLSPYVRVVDFEPSSIDEELMVIAINGLKNSAGKKFINLFVNDEGETQNKIICVLPPYQITTAILSSLYKAFVDEARFSEIICQKRNSIRRRNRNLVWKKFSSSKYKSPLNKKVQSKIEEYIKFVMKDISRGGEILSIRNEVKKNFPGDPVRLRKKLDNLTKLNNELPVYFFYVDLISTIIPAGNLENRDSLENQRKVAAQRFLEIVRSILLRSSELGEFQLSSEKDRPHRMLNEAIETFYKPHWSGSSGMTFAWKALNYWFSTSRKDISIEAPNENFKSFFNYLFVSWAVEP